MFEKFTDRARRVVVLAQENARLLGHNYIGTEHLLLGLVDLDGCMAQRVLLGFGVSRAQVAAGVEDIVGRGEGTPSGNIPFTPRAKKVLDLAWREALQLHHNHIGTEHILLGLMREGEGVGTQVLQSSGVDLRAVREKVISLVRDEGPDSQIDRSHDYPLCPLCASPLAETLAWRHVASSQRIDAGRLREVAVAYCSKCGRALGILP